MYSILVTGGAGFIGSHLCEALLKRDDHVLCVDNFNEYYDPELKKRNIESFRTSPNVELAEVDIRDQDSLFRLMSDREVDHVIHLAARAGVIPSVEDPQATFSNNVIGTQNVLELCRQKDIDHLTLASSSSVYGSRTKGPFKEEDKVSTPESPYAASKVMNEDMAHAYHSVYDISISCLRFFTVYGPRQRPDMAIHTFVMKLLTRNRLEVYGSPDSSRDYTFIDDIISGVVAAIDLETGFEIINLGNSEPVSLGTLVDVILDKTGVKVDVEWLPKRRGDVPLTYADISKAEMLLGYDPKTSIEDGVERFVQWYRDVLMR